MEITVKRKYRNKALKLLSGDQNAVVLHSDDFELVARVAIRLKEKQKRKKLSPYELTLLHEIEFILPVFMQLIDKCIDEWDTHMYWSQTRKIIMSFQKKALKGDKEAIKFYNGLVRHWGNYEPGKFQKIKP